MQLWRHFSTSFRKSYVAGTRTKEALKRTQDYVAYIIAALETSKALGYKENKKEHDKFSRPFYLPFFERLRGYREFKREQKEEAAKKEEAKRIKLFENQINPAKVREYKLQWVDRKKELQEEIQVEKKYSPKEIPLLVSHLRAKAKEKRQEMEQEERQLQKNIIKNFTPEEVAIINEIRRKHVSIEEMKTPEERAEEELFNTEWLERKTAMQRELQKYYYDNFGVHEAEDEHKNKAPVWETVRAEFAEADKKWLKDRKKHMANRETNYLFTGYGIQDKRRKIQKDKEAEKKRAERIIRHEKIEKPKQLKQMLLSDAVRILGFQTMPTEPEEVIKKVQHLMELNNPKKDGSRFLSSLVKNAGRKVFDTMQNPELAAKAEEEEAKAKEQKKLLEEEAKDQAEQEAERERKRGTSQNNNKGSQKDDDNDEKDEAAKMKEGAGGAKAGLKGEEAADYNLDENIFVSEFDEEKQPESEREPKVEPRKISRPELRLNHAGFYREEPKKVVVKKLYLEYDDYFVNFDDGIKSDGEKEEGKEEGKEGEKTEEGKQQEPGKQPEAAAKEQKGKQEKEQAV